MSTTELMESKNIQDVTLIQGEKARIKHTGQIVELKRVSEYGISVVCFRTGGDCFISNRFLVPVIIFH